MSATPRRPGVAAALGLVLIAAALAGCAQSPPPEDPSENSYIYRADHDEKAPHPASYEGGYDELEVDGPGLRVGADGPVTVLRENAGSQVSFPARLEVQEAQGTFRPDEGDPVDLDGRDVHVTSEESFEVTGVRSVDAHEATFTSQGVVTRTGGVDANDTFETSRTLDVAEGGAVAADVNVSVGDPPGEERPGTLELEAGSYGLLGSPVRVTASGPVDLPGEPGDVVVRGATANATLRGEERPVDGNRLEARSLGGQVRPGPQEVTLDLGLDQWWIQDRPQFEATLEAGFDDGSRERSVTLEPGGNATFWTWAEETSRVGSAEEVRPRIEDRILTGGFDAYWYSSSDPSAMERFIKTVVLPAKALQSIFEDPATRDFAPGDRWYIPFAVEVPNGTQPGTYRVDGWFHGLNARSPDLVVKVTVEEG